MDLLKTLVVLSSTTIVVIMAYLVLFGCFKTDFIFTFDDGVFKKASKKDWRDGDG
jgi:major membrane immunogen (membrane-anchored lipoprotein)